MKDVCSFGELLIDYTQQGVNDKGAILFGQYPGGAPGNVCAGVAKLGGQSSMLAKVGQDLQGLFLEEALKEAGVETKGIIFDSNHFTTLAFVSIDAAGERQFSFARKPGADTQIVFEEIDTSLIEEANIFHVGSLSLTDPCAKETTLQSIQWAKEHHKLISYDPNYRASLWPNEEVAKKEMRSLIPYADLMKISDEETELLTGKTDPKEAALQLLASGVKIVAITLGKDGALIASSKGIAIVPGFASKVVDTNGAGDSFWSALLYQISQSQQALDTLELEQLEKFTLFANAAAAITVTRSGAIPAMPSYEEVLQRIEQETSH